MNKARASVRQNTVIALVVTVFAIGVVFLLMLIGNDAPPSSPPTVPPVVEPVALMPISVDDARSANAKQAFVTSAIAPAAPFRFAGDAPNAARAADCLAAAVLYEAGDDAEGQRAVAQVVLNRVRHPAFPKSVCGVVFQGSERTTGCQFTFTCDGALARRYSSEAWERARGIAVDALHGAVFRPVGLSTHYHTDWVRPYWSPSMDKLAQVGTHLFFRWQGFWGTPAAYRGRVNGVEPVVRKLANITLSHSGVPLGPDGTPALDGSLSSAPVDAAAVRSAVAAVVPRDNRMLGDTILLTLNHGEAPESFPALAAAACGERAYCKVMAWTNPALAPAGDSVSDAARAAMSFSYLRNQQSGLVRALWNCTEFRRDQRGQCMRR